MKILTSIVFAVLYVGLAFGVDCNQTVYDQANLFGSGQASVVQAANNLARKGVEVRAWTLLSSDNLDITERQIEKQCLSWQSGDGERKSNLIVMLVALNTGGRPKMGLYAGSLFKKSVGDKITDIQVNYMRPSFVRKDWVVGYVSGLNQISYDIENSGVAPASTTTVIHQAEAPTDLSGFWWFLKGILIVGTTLFLCWFGFEWWEKRKTAKSASKEAQVRAVNNKKITIDAYNKLDDQIKEFEALNPGDPRASRARNLYVQLSRNVSNLTSYTTLDPDDSGLDVAAYDSITEQWERVAGQIGVINRVMAGVDEGTPNPPVSGGSNGSSTTVAEEPIATKASAATTSQTSSERQRITHYDDDDERPVYAPTYPVYTPYPVPVIIEDRQPEYQSPTEEKSSWIGGSVDKSEETGSSNDIVSEESSSSRSSDSDSSFSFDSGSSSSSSDSGSSSDFGSSDSGSSFDSGSSSDI